MSEICGNAPTMYANVPAEVIVDVPVVIKHCGLRSDSAKLPELVWAEATVAAATTEEKVSDTEEERDENGCSWAASATPPITNEFSVTSD